MIEQADVLIIGSGLAGLSAAVSASSPEHRCKVLLLTTGHVGQGGCARLVQGLNAPVLPDDNPALYVEDTMRGGAWLNDRRLTEMMCNRIGTVVRRLESMGVPFQRSDAGEFAVGTYGGSDRSRSVHCHDLLGSYLVHVLNVQSILNGCFVREQRYVLDLIVDEDGHCQGCAALNLIGNTFELYSARAVVLATGGGACVYPFRSFGQEKRGSGIVMAYRAGASLIDMEMVQFHPTGVILPGSAGNGSALEEELRTYGGKLINGQSVRFMSSYDVRGELATRDVVSRAIFQEVREGRGTINGGVILDLSELPFERIARRFPAMVQRLRSWGLDLACQRRIEVSPTAHFLMGGIKTSPTTSTEIKGLFAAGEDAGGIHGGNRLGGNGAADALVFGEIAGSAAAQYCRSRDYQSGADPRRNSAPALSYVDASVLTDLGIGTRIEQIMWEGLGPTRSRSGVRDAMSELQSVHVSLEDKMTTTQFEPGDSLPETVGATHAIRDKLTLARLIATSAFERSDSAGAHFLQDGLDGNHRYNVVVRRDGGRLVTARRPIPHA